MNKTPNATPSVEKLPIYLIGDLGPARRHIQRLLDGELPPTPSVLLEIQDSLIRCVRRIERDWRMVDALVDNNYERNTESTNE